jgi:FkbM family methyltransferase
MRMSSRTVLVLRAVIDCAYLVRSGLPRSSKVRVLREYARLTLKTAFSGSPAQPGTERVMRYSVRHFGLGSLQFLFREIFVRNEYFFAAASERPLVFDCGANIGLATLFFKWVYPECEIHAFEPDPDTFRALQDNVARNGLTDVHLFNVALTGSRGRLELFVPGGSAGSPLTSTLSGRNLESVRRVVVDGVPLSSHIGAREIDFLKMDVEGAEEPVLRELANTGKLRSIKELAVEYHHNIKGIVGSCGSFLQLLYDCGYQYQLDATWGSDQSCGGFQDVLVRARRAAEIPGRSTPAAAIEHANALV